MNSDKSWIMDYGSSLREKEDNFENVCCESSQPTVEYHEYVRLTRFEQRWNEDESSSVQREIVAFTMRVNPGLLEKQRRQQQSSVNASENEALSHKEKDPSKGQNLDDDSWMTYVEKTFIQNAHFQVRLLRHHDKRTVKKRKQRIGMLYFQHYERRSAQNHQINWKENSRVKIGRIAFTAEASNL